MNQPSHVASGFKTGPQYFFKVLAYNNFGSSPSNSSIFGIWPGLVPSGLSDPITSLTTLKYVDEDDIVVLDWDPPLDDGGLPVNYLLEIFSGLS